MINLPKEKNSLIKNIVNELTSYAEVKAIVLGGSYAMGMATENSDLDIGIYYYPTNPFKIQDIRAVANAFDEKQKAIVTDFYEWGAWVNGGAWIKTKQGKVDFIYKNIQQINTTIKNAKEGIWENDFEQQPPYGFSSIIFLAETYYCIPLFDPENIIANLKKEVAIYPQKLKQSVIQQSLWGAEFSIWQAKAFTNKNDVYNAVGCFTRAIKNLVTALFAINEIYPLGDKRAITIIENATVKPTNFSNKIEEILSGNKSSLPHNLQLLNELFSETKWFTNGLYQPYYNL